MENDRSKGLMLAFATFFMWGVFPIFFKLIKDVDAVQILAHRVVWSFLLLLVFLCFMHRLKNVARLLSTPKIALTLLCTGLLISTNWGIYIYAVNSDQILATSLGYFINPLFSVLLGALFLRERLSAAAKLSLLLAFAAIGVQIYALGRLPIISLVLPLSFAFYGLIRKKVKVPSFEGLFCETALMLLPALAFLIYCALKGSGAFGFSTSGALLFASGLITILPLLPSPQARSICRYPRLALCNTSALA